MSWFRHVFVNQRFYWYFGSVTLLFFLGVFAEIFFSIALVMLGAGVVLTVADWWILFGRGGEITSERLVGPRLSNGDRNPVFIEVHNVYDHRASLRIIDELPVQFQRRDLEWKMVLDPGEQQRVSYTVRPVKRGEYLFGALHVFVSAQVGFLTREHAFDAGVAVKVYPSYLQLKHYAFLAFDRRLRESGLKRIRKLGHTMEFEQIKEYVPGDDTRALNWKATARTAKPMVNQYQDERAQPVYCTIDKGRLMQMPFDGMTLLDYAINASLVMSYVAIHKNDRAGIIAFAEQVDSIIPAGRRNNQMYRILEGLYNQKTQFLEADFERLYAGMSRAARHRSLILLFTNFESVTGLKRQLPFLRKIADRHVLVVIFFRNTELQDLTEEPARSLREIYHQTLAEKMQYEKQLMVQILHQHGIHVILTTPASLTVDTINEYLMLKARGIV